MTILVYDCLAMYSQTYFLFVEYIPTGMHRENADPLKLKTHSGELNPIMLTPAN